MLYTSHSETQHGAASLQSSLHLKETSTLVFTVSDSMHHPETPGNRRPVRALDGGEGRAADQRQRRGHGVALRGPHQRPVPRAEEGHPEVPGRHLHRRAGPRRQGVYYFRLLCRLAWFCKTGC